MKENIIAKRILTLGQKLQLFWSPRIWPNQAKKKHPKASTRVEPIIVRPQLERRLLRSRRGMHFHDGQITNANRVWVGWKLNDQVGLDI